MKNVGNHGISIVGGSIGSGKKKGKGIRDNTISGCKQNGITVSGKATVFSIETNKISNVKIMGFL